MEALFEAPRVQSQSAASPTPRPVPSATTPEVGFPTASNGLSGFFAEPATASGECDSISTSRSCSPDIPRTIIANGVTYDVLRPEELSCEVPVFGERRRKSGATKLKKNGKRMYEEEDEAEWESKRRRLIQEKVLKKEFIGYKREEMSVTEDGLTLPEMPAWLNITRELQDDGSLGIFIARPSKDAIETRWPEIIQALEPIGVEVGAVKVALPSEYLDDPVPVEEVGMRRSPSPFPTDQSLPNGPIASIPANASVLLGDFDSARSCSPWSNEHADLIPSPQLDRNGIPKIWIVDQSLPLHNKSVSNLAPIYRVSSTNKRQISGAQLLVDIADHALRQRRIAEGDTTEETFGPLTESEMLSRGRSWAHISNGDNGGISIYSSDNDADPYTRAYLGVGDPRLTGLPGNVMFESKSKILGIHSPFFYFGRAHTLFALHAEDYNAMSLNYHHFGADKIWRVVSPHYYHVVEDFVAAHIRSGKKGRKKNQRKCSQFVRHASIYLPGPTLEIAGARSIQFRQRPGELVITWPLAYHEGYNEGLNINEACGYGHKNWRRVFATGEEEKGEEAIYRPCGERCMGKANPIILDFEPEVEAGETEEGIDGEDDITTFDEMIDEVFLTLEGLGTRGSSAGSTGLKRKRSYPRGQEDDGDGCVQVEHYQPPLKKVNVIIKDGRDVAENTVSNHFAASRDGSQNNSQKKHRNGSQNLVGHKSEDDCNHSTANDSTTANTEETLGVENDDNPKTKSWTVVEHQQSSMREMDDENHGDKLSTVDESKKGEDDESEAEGVNLVPVQSGVELESDVEL